MGSEMGKVWNVHRGEEMTMCVNTISYQMGCEMIWIYHSFIFYPASVVMGMTK